MGHTGNTSSDQRETSRIPKVVAGEFAGLTLANDLSSDPQYDGGATCVQVQSFMRREC